MPYIVFCKLRFDYKSVVNSRSIISYNGIRIYEVLRKQNFPKGKDEVRPVYPLLCAVPSDFYFTIFVIFPICIEELVQVGVVIM